MRNFSDDSANFRKKWMEIVTVFADTSPLFHSIQMNQTPFAHGLLNNVLYSRFFVDSTRWV